MALLKSQRVILKKLADYPWAKLPSNSYHLNFDKVDSRERAEGFAQSVQEVIAILTQAGLKENLDFSICNAAKFLPDDIHRLDIPYPLLINHELNLFLEDALIRKQTRSNIAKS